MGAPRRAPARSRAQVKEIKKKKKFKKKPLWGGEEGSRGGGGLRCFVLPADSPGGKFLLRCRDGGEEDKGQLEFCLQNNLSAVFFFFLFSSFSSCEARSLLAEIAAAANNEMGCSQLISWGRGAPQKRCLAGEAQPLQRLGFLKALRTDFPTCFDFLRCLLCQSSPPCKHERSWHTGAGGEAGLAPRPEPCRPPHRSPDARAQGLLLSLAPDEPCITSDQLIWEGSWGWQALRAEASTLRKPQLSLPAH